MTKVGGEELAAATEKKEATREGIDRKALWKAAATGGNSSTRARGYLPCTTYATTTSIHTRKLARRRRRGCYLALFLSRMITAQLRPQKGSLRTFQIKSLLLLSEMLYANRV